MRYCPYCSAQISESAKSCHSCKKSLDFEAISNLFEPGEESAINKSAQRKIWLKEHARFVWPVVTLVAGFIIGGVILYSMARMQSASEKEALSSEIRDLKNQIEQINTRAAGAQSGLKGELEEKDRIISILTNQRKTMGSIINFTRRFTNGSAVTPNSEGIATSFKNNFRYLQRQFESQQEELNQTAFKNNRKFNLKTAPQFLGD